jgi:hypothetical protein
MLERDLQYRLGSLMWQRTDHKSGKMVCALLSMKVSQYVEETAPDSHRTSISTSTSFYGNEG